MLLGGSSLIPKVQQIAKLYFNGKEPMNEATSLIDPAEAVARGAAVQGSNLKRWRSEVKDVCCLSPDLTFLTLGVETGGGFLTTVIKRGTVLPTKKSILMPMDHDW